MGIPRVLRIFRQIWIYFLGLLITTAVFLTWYQLDPFTPQIAWRYGAPNLHP
jgi:hypothetical protein